jgi:mRNA interferase MazF
MYSAGTIVLMEFPFTDGAIGKPRPALVVFDSGDVDVLVARITTRPQFSSCRVEIRVQTLVTIRHSGIGVWYGAFCLQ